MLHESNLYRVEKLLGRPYCIKGKVIYGQQLGRTIGVPTANIRLNMKKPAVNGVYAVKIVGVINTIEKEWFGVANAGAKPTVNQQKPQLEVHLFDCDEQLYGEQLSVTFCHKIRGIKKFSGIEALKKQIQQDIQIAKNYFRLSDQND
jgi:riboflavin kinase / FMN adenylyltransferase